MNIIFYKKLSAVLLLLVSCNASSSFFVAEDDLSVVINNKLLFSELSRIEGTYYKGEYTHGGMICSSIPVQIGFEKFKFGSRSVLDSSGTSVNQHLSFKSDMRFNAGCGGAGASLVCDASSVLKSALEPYYSSAHCRYEVRLVGIPIKTGTAFSEDVMKVPPLLSAPQPIELKLNDTAELTMSFGTYENGVWKDAKDRHTRSIRIHSQVISSSGNVSRLRELSFIDNGSYLRSSFLVGSPLYRRYESREQFEKAYNFYGKPMKANDLMRINLNSSFFSKRSSQRDSGLFGELLPIRIKSKKDSDIDYVISEAAVSFGGYESEPGILVSFRLESLVPNSHLGYAHAYVLFSEPKMIGRDLVITLKSAKLRVLSGGSTNDVCLDSLFTDNIATKLLTVGQVSQGVKFKLPECISVPVEQGNLTAARVCPNNSRADQISRTGNFSVIDIEPDVSNVKVELSDDGEREAFSITMPVLVNSY